MPQELSGIPYFEVQFTEAGTVNDPAQEQALVQFLAQGATTDLIVISHGWNNDMDEARAFYGAFFDQVQQVLASGRVAGLDGRTFAIAGVLWPAKKFTDPSEIPGGAAAIGSPVTPALLAQGLDRLKGAFSDETSVTDQAALTALDQAKALLHSLNASPTSRAQFVERMRAVAPNSAADPADVDASPQFLHNDPGDVFAQLSNPAGQEPGTVGGGGALDVGAGGPPAPGGVPFLALLTGFEAAALKLINYTTYYVMKARAGLVGSTGVHQLLQHAKDALPGCRQHLVGHSFGARLVTAATMGPAGGTGLAVDSLTLLQGAFSQFGFAVHFEGAQDGFFRATIANHDVHGPGLITHSVRDQAVGLAYPIAALLAHDEASALGDANSLFGGMGRNGAQKTPEAVNLQLLDAVSLDTGQTYDLKPGQLHNLNGDAIIQDHGDVCRVEVATALLSGIAAT